MASSSESNGTHGLNMPISVGDDLVALRIERLLLDLDEAAARIIAVEAERDKLRQIISDCAKALTNGAFIAPSASVEFMALLPSEIAAAWATQPSPQEPS